MAQHRKIGMSDIVKSFLVIFLLTSLLIGTVFALIYDTNTRSDRDVVESKEDFNVTLQKELIAGTIRMIVSDLLVQASHHELQLFIDSGTEVHLRGLRSELLAFSREKGIYDQVRLINASGMEVLRINLSRGNSYLVPKDRLQSKADRYYFKEAMRLTSREVFISPLDLNVERAEVERPFKPVIRFATPVFYSDGRKYGILILNLLGEELLENLRKASSWAVGQGMLLNSDGYWLRAPNPTDEWGFMFEEGKDRRFEKLYPESWKRVTGSPDSGQFYNEDGLFTFETVYPISESLKYGKSAVVLVPRAKDYYWKIVSHVSPEVLTAWSHRFLRELLYLYIVVVGVVGTGSWFIAQMRVRRRQVEEELRKYRYNLEDLVERRTADLTKTNELLHVEVDERKRVEEEREKILHAKGERVKELQCMYGVTESIRTRNTLEEIFQDVADLIPPGWHYPEITRGKVMFDGKEYVSESFEETGWKQSCDIIVNGEGRGSIEVYYLEECPALDEGPFMTEERNLINGMAKGISEAIERKLAEEKLLQEVEITRSLFKISEATAQTTNMGRLMDNVAINVKAIMGSDMTLIYLWNAETKYFIPFEGAGLRHKDIPLFKSEKIDPDMPFIKKALDTSTYVVADGNADEDLRAVQEKGLYVWLKDLGSLIVVPLSGKKACLGLLVCAYRQENHRFSSGFTGRDNALLRGIGHHISVALEEARYYKDSIDRTMELSHKIETIRAMHEIDRSILSTVDPQEVLEIAVNMIAKVISCDRCTIALVDKEKGGFTYAAGHGLTSVKIGNLVPFGETSATEIVETLRPQYISNLTVLKSRLPLEERLLGEGFLSHIRIPLVVRSEAVGVLTVGAKRPAAFTPDDLSTFGKLAAQVGVALENARLINDLKKLLISIIRTLSEAIDAKSPWTRGHSERVTGIALYIGRAMGLGEEELKDFEVVGLLHDVGKIGTLEKILDKPGKLDEDELKLLREHPAKGVEILRPIKQLGHILPVIRHHHEFYDGTGYPDGLKGTEIPLQARILAVADTVDAMRSDRPYRKGMDMEKVVEELKRCSGTQFDPGVVEGFFKTLERSKG